jgi:hypothetical protein
MLLLLAGVAAVAVALFLLGRMRTRLEASFLAEELQEMGGGTWQAVPVNPAWGRFSRGILAGEVGGDRVEVAGSPALRALPRAGHPPAGAAPA